LTQMTETTPRRAVLLEIPPVLEEWRKRTGADRYDEVWEGVVHMSPTPTGRHQGLCGNVYAWLLRHFEERACGKVYYQRNVARPGLADWRTDYRAPDLVLVTPPRYARDLDTHFEGGPDVVVEICSPGDESYDKLPFYFAIGVEEVWIIHRDTKVPELFVRGARGFRGSKPNRDGWLLSKATDLELRTAANAKLALRRRDEHATTAEVPAE